MFQFNPKEAVINYLENIWLVPDHPTHFAPSIEVYSPLQSSWVQKGCPTAEPGRTYTPATYVNCHYIKLKWTSFLSWNCRPATKDPPPSLSFH